MEGFEIKVPIALKGGREGEKIGKQIGEHIAAQLKKILGTARIGEGQTRGGGGFNLGKMAVKLGLISVGLNQLLETGKKVLEFISKSSPYLKGILNMFGRAFMIFFRPFGDFLATLLRPMAILLMKMAVKFMKWMRPIVVGAREGAEKAPQLAPGALGVGGIGTAVTDIINALLKLGGSIGQVIYNIGKAAFDLGGKIGQWIYDKVIVPAGEFLADKIIGAWNWIKDFPGWLWEQITSIWTWTLDFGSWLWEKVTSIWSWTYNFGDWLWGKITSIFAQDRPGLFRLLFPKKGEGQAGIASVQSDGLYQLHRGEEVVPKTKVGNRSTILKPTFNFTGNMSQDIDVDAIARRASRITEMELKQRGIL